MRKTTLAFLITFTLLLPACSPEQETDDELFAGIQNLTDFTAEALIIAEFSDRSSTFRVECAVAGEGATVRVLEPALIEGIAVAIDPSGCAVSFDGASFALGEVDGAAPVSAIAELKRLWCGSAPRESGRESAGETDLLRCVYPSGSDEAHVLFDPATLAPKYAEFYRDGSLFLTVEFVSFEIGGS